MIIMKAQQEPTEKRNWTIQDFGKCRRKLSLLTLLQRRFKRKPKFQILFLLGLVLVSRRYRYSKESFSLANGRSLFKLNKIPNLELVQRVMSLVLLLLPNPTLVLRVRRKTGNLHWNSFVICGADDTALHWSHGSNWRQESWGRWVWGSDWGRGFGETGKRRGAINKRGGKGEGFELGEGKLKERRS